MNEKKENNFKPHHRDDDFFYQLNVSYELH